MLPVILKVSCSIGKDFRKLGEKEKLLRICAQISSFPSQEPVNETTKKDSEESSETAGERESHFETMLEMLEEIEEDVVTDGSEMVAIRACRITETSTQKVIPGSEVTLELLIESNFPR